MSSNPTPSTPSTPPRRHFQPQLIETTSTSPSIDKQRSDDKAPQSPPEAKRKFAPQLMEMTTRSSTEARLAANRLSAVGVASPPKRSFAPVPVETTSRSHKPSDSSMAPLLPHERLAPPETSPKRRFAPVPVETTSRSNRMSDSRPRSPLSGVVSPSRDATRTPDTVQDTAKPKRRFAPQLLETATRSRKTGDTLPAVLARDKTNVSPGDVLREPRPLVKPIQVPSNTPNHSAYEIPLRPLPNRKGSLHVHYNTPRSHSYRVPSLDVIESSGSSEGSSPSHSRSHSASSASETTYKHATRARESVDDRFSGYLLALAARAAEKQLREQEAAAFATSDFHEPVAHYAADREDSGEEVVDTVVGTKFSTYRRDSGDEQIALQEIRKHGEQIKKRQEEERRTAVSRKKTAAFNVEFDSIEANQDAWIAQQAPKNIIGGYQNDPDLKCMRKAASPPMLGGDIDFPRCPSPEHARFDVTQGPDFLRANMCYLTEQGMWDGKSKRPSVLTRDSKDNASKQSNNSGLWGGFCTGADARMSPTSPTGLVTPMRTPAVEKDDPFAQYSSGASVGTSIAGKRPGPPTAVGYPSPPSSSSAQLDEALEIESRLTAEFSDDFVTQVFNYLSLGYPALARKFDDELSKISGVAVDELRTDDDLAEAHGYIRLGDEEPTAEDMGVDTKDCRRWLALKSYCREWGRQMIINQKEVAGKEDPHRAWGFTARKGSWSN